MRVLALMFVISWMAIPGPGFQKPLLNADITEDVPSSCRILLSDPLTIFLPHSGKTSVKLYNVQGGLVLSSSSDFVDAGVYRPSMLFQHLPDGVYVLDIVCDGHRWVSKFLVRRK